MKLEELHKTIRRWLYLKDMNRVDLILAVHMSRKLSGTKLWLIFVGGSGASKSELLKALDDDGKETFTLQEITGSTLVSGNPIAQDLAPQLHNKTLLIPDMAILLNLRKEEKAKVWAQFRELFDGNCGKNTGSGKQSKRYKGLNVTLLACSTGAIDDQILIHQSLGTRELIFRINPIEEKAEEEKLMQRVIHNEKFEVKMRHQIKCAFDSYLNNRKLRDITIGTNSMKKIKNYVSYLRVMRTTASFDSYSGDVLSTVEPESPTRVLKQFIRLYSCLMNLDPKYSDTQALKILKEVRDSSCNQDRIKIINVLAANPADSFSIHEISQRIRLGKTTVRRHLNLLWNLKLIDRLAADISDSSNWHYSWQINQKHALTKIIVEELEKQ